MIIQLEDGYSFNPKGRCDCGRGPTITDYNGEETCRRCSIGFYDDEIAWRRVDAGEVPGLVLAAIAARDQDKARRSMAGFRSKPKLLSLEALAEAYYIVEDYGALAGLTAALASEGLHAEPLIPGSES